MSQNSIEIENLAKSYLISHKTHSAGSYVALRDVITDSVAGLGKKLAKKDESGVVKGGKEEFWALKDISLNIKKGERIGIIGKNGSGKTTLLKILSRITEPTQGNVKLRGRTASILEVGTGFHPELTGRENIYLNGAILGMTRAEINHKFDEIVAFSEIEKFLDTPVKRYSSGMYLRLAFSVSAHLETEIMLVDEVLAVGDAAFQKKCMGKMEQSTSDERTILFVSHNMAAIKQLCNKVILLKNGMLEKVGEPEEVINHYLATERDSSLTKEWSDSNAPGNDSIRIKSIKIIPGGDIRVANITVNTPVNIEFEFYNLEPATELNLSMVLWTLSGECVLNTASEVKKLDEGLFVGTCHIPPDFLNDNIYSVEILFVKNMSYAVYKQKDIISFEVHDIAREKAWFGKWVGVVRPKLKFDLEKIHSAK